MRWRSFVMVAVLAMAACEKPNLEATEGGYGSRRVAQASAAAADTASHAAAADTAAPAPADTATP